MCDGSDYVSTDNYELRATFTERPSNTISSEAYNAFCSYWGTFSPNSSPIFFNETYGDGSYYAGTYGTDLASIANITLKNSTFGASNTRWAIQVEF